MKNLAIIDNEFGIVNKNNIPMVTSRVVAEKFGKEHDNVLKAIRNAIHTLEEVAKQDFNAVNFNAVEYKDKKGQLRPEYLLTRDGFSFIVMGFTGSEAAKWKVEYIKAFDTMEQYILDRNKARMDYLPMTEAIKNAHEEPKFYHYSNEADMINKLVTGMSAKKLKEFRQEVSLPLKTDTRDLLTSQEIHEVEVLQRANTEYIEAGIDYIERKEILSKRLERLRRRVVGSEK